MKVPIDNVGSIGLIQDIFAPDTPPEAWTQLQNARMGPQGAEAFLGHTQTLGTATGWNRAPFWLFYVPVPGGTNMWVGAADTKVLCRSAISPYAETDITRAAGAYNASDTTKWNGGVYGGLLVLNNSADLPQVWSPPTSATLLVNISTFGTSPWNANWRCANLQPFGRFLVAMDMTETGTRYPQKIRWSTQADAGAMPISWNDADPTVDAGSYQLQDAIGPLVEQEDMGGGNMLYTTDQVWVMQYIRGGLIFAFNRKFAEQGAIATHCVAKFKKNPGEFHCVLGGSDVFVHNGYAAESILSPKLRRWFLQQIDVNYYSRSFVVANPLYTEIWVCIPENGAQQPTLALVWNWTTGSVGFRDLLKGTSGADTRTTAATRGTPCVSPGFLSDVILETWNSDSNVWDSDTTVWDVSTTNPAVPRLLMADRSAGKRTFLVDNGGTYDGLGIAWTMERTGLSIIGHDRMGNPKSDSEIVKLLTEVWPRIDAKAGTAVTVNIATQDTQNGAVTWSQNYTYTVGDTVPFLPVYHSGRYLGVRFSVPALSAAAKLLGYGLEIEQVGHY